MSSNLLTILGSGIRSGSITAYFFLLISVIQPAFGQITFDSKEELIEAANTFFNEGAYAKAKPLFSQLLSQDALNADYNYRFGVCILFTEDDPVKPMPYIEGGAGSPGVNNEAFYFLGKLYQLNYRFDEAVEAYTKAKSKGVTLPGVDLDKEMQACRNGKLLYDPAYEFNPESAKNALEKEFFRPYDFRKLKGKVIPTPPQFKTKFDEKNLTGSFVFTPLIGESLFYASYGENGASGKDLYRVRKLPNGEWALPVRLPDVINSKMDEDHAFFDAENEVLYFSSQGHNSMGGSDIFQSSYNSKDDSWSPPVNMQYPYSSPYDDFLYVTDPEGTVAFFSSTRESELGQVMVFRVNLPSRAEDPVSIISGQYSESKDSTQTKMTAQLRSGNNLIGEYRTNPKTGKYLIMAEPGQGYQLSVAPRNKENFEFTIDIPKHYKFRALEQQTSLKQQGETYSVELTNYFNRSGELDTVRMVQSKGAGELPGILASVKGSVSESANATITDAERQGQNEASEEIAALEQELRQKAQADSLAQFENVAEAALKQEQEAAAALAAEKAEQARLDSLAEVERLATEAALKQEQESAAALAAEKAERARLDSLAEVERLAAEAALKQEQESAAALAAEKGEQARLDSLAEVERLAAEAALKQEQESAAALAAEKAEQARLDSLFTIELIAVEKARLDSINIAVENLKAAARLDSVLADVESSEPDRAEDQLLKLAEERARESHTITEKEISEAEQSVKAEESSISNEELNNALVKATSETGNVDSVDLAMAEETAMALESSSLLDSLNAELESLLINLSSTGHENPSEDPRVAELSEQIAVQSKLDDERKAARLLAKMDERMEQSKLLEKAKMEEEQRLKDKGMLVTTDHTEKASLDSLAEVERLVAEAALKQEQEAAVLAAEKAAQARKDSVALALGPDELTKIDSEQPMSAADAFLRAIEDAEKVKSDSAAELTLAEMDVPAIVEDDLKEEAVAIPSEDPFIDEIESSSILDEKTLSGVEMPDDEDDTMQPDSGTAQLASAEIRQADSLAREIELGMARAEAEAMEKALENERLMEDSLEGVVVESVYESDPVTQASQIETIPMLEDDVDDTALINNAVADLQSQLTPKVVAVVEKEAEPELSDIEQLDSLSGVSDVSRTIEENTLVEEEEIVETTIDLLEESESSTDSLNTTEFEPVQEKDNVLQAEVAMTIADSLNMEQTEQSNVLLISTNEDRTKTELTEADAFLLAIEEAEKALMVKGEEEHSEERTLAAQEAEPVPAKEESEVQGSNDDDWLKRRNELAREKERALQEKMNADRAALGLAIKEEPAPEPEPVVFEEPVDTVLASAIKVESDSIETHMEDEAISVESEIGESIKIQRDEVALTELEEMPEMEIAEPEVEGNSSVKVETEMASLELENGTTSEQKEIRVPESAITEEAGSSEASRLFFITPAMRDYSKRKVNLDEIADRFKRRLIQRMLAEDIGRLGVLKNIHNTRIELGNDATERARFDANRRNSEVLADRIAGSQPALETKEASSINWFDRNVRLDIEFRLAFTFEPKPVSTRIREAMDPLSEAGFGIGTVNFCTGKHRKLADARAEFLEFRSRGYSNMEIQAFEKGKQIELSEVFNRPVIEN